MGCYVLGFQEIDQTQVAVVGGKGAHLGELSRIEGIRVPAGFCVTTDAFRRIMAEAPSIDDRLDRLSRLNPDDREAIRTLSAEIRRTLEGIAIPDDLAAAITRALARLGEQAAYAVRSSATAEDLPTASFAGQQDTYLNVVGPAAILQHVSRCWASLFTERAVTYRLRNGFDHRKVHMAVVVQQMVFPQAAGILFTADPVTGNRKVASVEASFGLGEALVSGLVNADVYKVRDGEVVAKAVATKQLAIHASPAGGTQEQAIEPERQEQPALTDAQVVRLAQLGRRIEAHFGRPQDIEWCLVDDDFQIVQSRPITTLFPIPEAGDRENHVYVSVGHQQMMTDPMKPLGLSFWQLTTPAPMARGRRAAVRRRHPAAWPRRRAAPASWRSLGRSDPLIGDALQTILDRGDFIRSLPDEGPGRAAGWRRASPDRDRSGHRHRADRAQPGVHRRLEARHPDEVRTGAARLHPGGHPGAEADPVRSAEPSGVHGGDGGRVVAQRAAAGVAGREERGRHAHAVRPPQRHVGDGAGAPGRRGRDPPASGRGGVSAARRGRGLPGRAGRSSRAGGKRETPSEAYLDKYGMRCVGEIDITRPRWSERPTTLVPVILGNIKNFEPGAGERRFEQGRQEAWKKEQELLERLRALPDGERKAEETKRMIDRVRTFIGYREYPKYGMVSRYFVYKQALLEEAERLVQAHVLREKEDIFYLTFQELHDVVRTNQVDDQLIRQRKDAFRSYQALTPPRVLTSDGEVIAGAYRRDDVPAGALVGLPVSAGTVEGRARVILDMAEADLEAGDILVTAYTDPSWTPLFVAITGLVTEVGGLMTHGAVIAREYGLPAVVGVEHATRLIRDGQRIRVHGTDGYVEILP